MTLVTASSLAGKLGVHVNTIYRLAQRGEIPVALHVGPRIRFDLDAVLEALKDAEQQPRPSAAYQPSPSRDRKENS